MADLVIMAAVDVVVAAVVVVVVVMVAVVHSRCCCTHQSHATSGHPAAPAVMIHELPLLRPQLIAASSVADTTAAAAAADVDPLDPTRLAPQARTKLILGINISFNKCGDFIQCVILIPRYFVIIRVASGNTHVLIYFSRNFWIWL